VPSGRSGKGWAGGWGGGGDGRGGPHSDAAAAVSKGGGKVEAVVASGDGPQTNCTGASGSNEAAAVVALAPGDTGVATVP